MLDVDQPMKNTWSTILF